MKRCIYTCDTLLESDPKLKPSCEHIVPLALGGSNGLTTDDVSVSANARAGNEIDDEVASLFPFLALRQRYRLAGNRRSIPHVKLKGEFVDLIGVEATLDIDPDANLSFRFEKEQTQVGHVVSFSTTEERFRFLMKARLEQARQRQLNILTPFGQIKDEEDIEIALLLAERKEAKQFKASLVFDLTAFHFAVVRLMVKIAIGLGHRVLGASWTFSPAGDLLRKGLWATPGQTGLSGIRGQWTDSIPPLEKTLNVRPDTHVLAVVPGKLTSAYIALFGGEMGVCAIDLGINTDDQVEKGFGRNGCVFEIPIASDVSQRRLVSRTFEQVADEAVRRGLA